MISKLVKNSSSLFHKSSRGYYKIIRERDYSENAIPVYSANKYLGLEKVESLTGFVDTVYNDKFLHQRYLKLLPFFVESLLGIHKKHLVVKLGLLEKAECLRVTAFTNSGLINKHIGLDNVIPTPFHDFLAGNRRKMLEMPLFLDPEMIYYNTMDQEFYVFDKEGQWHKEGVSHPLLDVGNRFNERKWFDSMRIH